jgi:predicted RNase H-related nuclease YkuK (DUF458 family)
MPLTDHTHNEDNMLTSQRITLRLDEPEQAAAAAQFVAELVRQGVTFEAHEDIGRHPSGLSSAPVLEVNFTGGF